MNALLTPEEAAAILNIRSKDGSPNARWIYTHKREVGAKKIGGFLRVPLENLNAYIHREPEAPPPIPTRGSSNEAVARLIAEARESLRQKRTGR